ncbi:MAG TPA: UDP-glucose/GDP-mannose dehydrogenase family protein [Frankiaceae bacterium]|nr:UDP-glucose/GDP-mannose dehydrogenase family protein [Frankiaceae bacterium]
MSTTDRPGHVTVVGTGYLGATHAVCMAELGFPVLGMDVDARKVAALSAGEVPFFEPGLEELLRKNLERGRLSFTTSYEEVGEVGDVHFVCVGTPQRADSYAADLAHLDAAVGGLLPWLRPGALVVGKSTVPAGTARGIAERIRRRGPEGAELAWNPEFLREGHAVEDTLRPDRLVFGVDPGGRGESLLRGAYAPVIDAGTPVVVVDFATAELVKVAANAFLATKISFINAMAEVCETTGADVRELSRALSYDARIGGRFLQPGLGFGGGCLPKDIRAFMARAEELGVEPALSFLREVDAINLRRRARMVDLARELVGGSFAGTRVGVLGAAFKPNSDDIRDSPALDVAAAILRQGARVTVYDPAAMDNARRMHPELGYADSAVRAAGGADVVLHLTEWHEFREMDPAVLSEVVAARRIVDGRNALDRERWRAAGWTYRALGRP